MPEPDRRRGRFVDSRPATAPQKQNTPTRLGRVRKTELMLAPPAGFIQTSAHVSGRSFRAFFQQSRSLRVSLAKGLHFQHKATARQRQKEPAALVAASVASVPASRFSDPLRPPSDTFSSRRPEWAPQTKGRPTEEADMSAGQSFEVRVPALGEPRERASDTGIEDGGAPRRAVRAMLQRVAESAQDSRELAAVVVLKMPPAMRAVPVHEFFAGSEEATIGWWRNTCGPPPIASEPNLGDLTGFQRAALIGALRLRRI